MAKFEIVPGRVRVRVDNSFGGGILFTSNGGGGSSSGKYEKPIPRIDKVRAQVYATGNKWEIENFEATHS